MEKFEIHITGTENILQVLENLQIKSLHAEMRSPTNFTLGDEYMSSFTIDFKNYEICKKWVDTLVTIIESEDVVIFRVKIECPYYYEHYLQQSVYLECHFPVEHYTTCTYPFVYNVNSMKYVGTDRVYLKSEYEKFIEKWSSVEKTEIELCLYDDNIRHDDAWISLFSDENKSKKVKSEAFRNFLFR